jgi:hypothetical protein
MDVRTSRGLLILIVAAIVLFAVIHLCAVSQYWEITPDSTGYVNAARSLASGQGYRTDGRRVALFPPGTSLLLAVPLLFSKSTYFGMNRMTTLFAILAIPVVYCWAGRDFDQVTAALVSLLTISCVFLFEEAKQNPLGHLLSGPLDIRPLSVQKQARGNRETGTGGVSCRRSFDRRLHGTNRRRDDRGRRSAPAGCELDSEKSPRQIPVAIGAGVRRGAMDPNSYCINHWTRTCP